MVAPIQIGPPPTAIAEQAYQKLCRLIFEHSHIHLGPGREALLTSRLGVHLRQLGLESWEHYVEILRDGANSEQIGVLIDLISTNHTQFFREPSHFRRLSEGLLDQLLLDCPQADHELRCWSAATSTGEEAYSLAIMLSEFAISHGGLPSWIIEASDISRQALRRAQAAIYKLDTLHLPRPELLARYFQRGSGPFEGQCKLKAMIRERIKLRRINLFQNSYPLIRPFHVIFCRNVLIYFRSDSQRQLVERLHGMLAPGGLLVIGHSDSLVHLRHDFSSLGGGIYRRSL